MKADPVLREAAELIRSATSLLITAGAGMGVDSGLPDFRGDEGFWKAYPPFAALGLRFVDLANPTWFMRDAALAWGFYGHRLNLYRDTTPHAGFEILRRLAATKREGAFVLTSNVDGQFQRSGFDETAIVEVHGSIHFAECARGCGLGIVEADFDVEVDASFRATSPLPRCSRCSAVLRPNILMFGDSGWDSSRTDAQSVRFERWLGTTATNEGRLVIVECGAGTSIPTVRRLGESLARKRHAGLVRINLREPEVPNGQIGIPMGARDALIAIEALLDAE